MFVCPYTIGEFELYEEVGRMNPRFILPQSSILRAIFVFCGVSQIKESGSLS